MFDHVAIKFCKGITALTLKITISSIVIGLKIPTFHLLTWKVVIGQFNKPITFKVVV